MRLNAGMPVWHVSVSAWSRREERSSQPAICEREAVKLLRGAGGDREWWFFNTDVLVGHLRVGVTEAEFATLPKLQAVNDAGETGTERPRTMR
jgi:hypothetical protein